MRPHADRVRPTAAALLCLVTACATEPTVDAAAPAPIAQEPDDPRRATVERIFAGALASTRAHATLTELCRVAPKRLSGSPGAERAVAWAADAMRAAGLENVRLEPVRVPRWERGEVERLVIVAPESAGGGELATCALGGSVATPAGGLEAEVVRVTSFEELSARASEARGRFVFFDRPMDPALADPFEAYGGAVSQRSRGPVEAARVGAVGAIVRSMTLALDDHPHTGATRYDDAFTSVPAVAISTLAAQSLAGLIATGGAVKLRLELDCRTLPDIESANVVGELRGREIPEEIVLLGAHLDAWDVGSGAHDDGAGCVHVIEAVRLLAELGLRPRRTVRVCLFMNEENGLRGGLAYRDAHLAELPRHVLALETDRGGFTPRGFGTDAPPEVFARLEASTRLLHAYGAGLLVKGGGGADISPLAEHGVVLCEYVPDAARYFDVHHAETDVIEAVHPRELALGAAAIAAFAWCAAEAQ